MYVWCINYVYGVYVTMFVWCINYVCEVYMTSSKSLTYYPVSSWSKVPVM